MDAISLTALVAAAELLEEAPALVEEAFAAVASLPLVRWWLEDLEEREAPVLSVSLKERAPSDRDKSERDKSERDTPPRPAPDDSLDVLLWLPRMQSSNSCSRQHT